MMTKSQNPWICDTKFPSHKIRSCPSSSTALSAATSDRSTVLPSVTGKAVPQKASSGMIAPDIMLDTYDDDYLSSYRDDDTLILPRDILKYMEHLDEKLLSRSRPQKGIVLDRQSDHEIMQPQVGFPDNFVGTDDAGQLIMDLVQQTHPLPELKNIITQRNIITYNQLKENAKMYLPLQLPNFEMDAEIIHRLHKIMKRVMRPHDRDVFGGSSPKMIAPKSLHLLKYNSEPVCLGVGSHGLIAQAQSFSTKTLYVVKYYTKSSRPLTDHLQDMIHEAAVQQAAHTLLPSMVPRVKGFVAINDQSGTFMPCGLVTEFIPVVEGSLNALCLSKAMHIQSVDQKTLFSQDAWLNFANQIVCGFNLLSRYGITHNDIKPDNILLQVSTDCSIHHRLWSGIVRRT